MGVLIMARKPGGPPADTTPPAKVTDLSGYQDGEGGDVILQWTAAGDDGFSGTAAWRDIRRATFVIVTESDWNNATSEFGGWEANTKPGGQADSWLPYWQPGNNYYALRYKDEAENVGPISNCVMVPCTP